MKRENTSFSIELGKLCTYTLFFNNYEIDLNTHGKTDGRKEGLTDEQTDEARPLGSIKIQNAQSFSHFKNSGRKSSCCDLHVFRITSTFSMFELPFILIVICLTRTY